MDTIVIATGMPFALAFLGQSLDDVVGLWEHWVDSAETVRVRHEKPERDTVVLLRPAVLGATQFIPHELVGRAWADRMLYTLPYLQGHSDISDVAPDRAYYWTLNPSGFSATPEQLPDGRTGLVLGNWDLGRI